MAPIFNVKVALSDCMAQLDPLIGAGELNGNGINSLLKLKVRAVTFQNLGSLSIFRKAANEEAKPYELEHLDEKLWKAQKKLAMHSTQAAWTICSESMMRKNFLS